MTPPAASEPIRLAGADGTVAISTDADGRRSALAETWADAAFALGWCVATDRPGQLDALRRTAQGRLAQIAGPAALAGDIWHRLLRTADTAAAGWQRLPAEQKRLTETFTRGVRAAAAGDPRISDWAPADCLGVAQLLLEQLSSDGTDNRMVEVLRRSMPAEVVDFLLSMDDPLETAVTGEPAAGRSPDPPLGSLRRLLAEPADEDPILSGRIVVRDGRPAGSNAWAVSDGRQAVLANDMHLPLTAPSTWYPVSLQVGARRVAGGTVPGLPMVVAGSTQRLAWGYTRLTADNADLRELPEVRRETPTEPDQPDQYRVRTETIEVLGAEDFVLRVEDTVYGPVVNELRGRRIAFASPLTDPAALDFGAVGLYTADDVAAGIDVVRHSGLAPVNAILADADGAVGWTVGGRHRRRTGRPRGFADSRPAPMVEPRELPCVVRATGAVVSANNATPHLRSAGLGWNWFGGGRARRIGELLGAHDVDLARSVSLQGDDDAAFYLYYRDLVGRHVRPSTGPVNEVRAEVMAWQGSARVEEVGLALLVVLRECLREAVFAALTRPAQRYDPEFVYCHHNHEPVLRAVLDRLDEGLLPAPWRSAGHFIAGQLLLARSLLTSRTGWSEPLAWGAVNAFAPTAVPGTPHASVVSEPVPLSGCMESVHVTAPDFGPALSLVATPRDGRGVIGVPGGVREHADAAHADAVRRWIAGEWAPLGESEPDARPESR